MTDVKSSQPKTGNDMDIVRRAYLVARAVSMSKPSDIESLHNIMIKLMVRWIKGGGYSLQDWPAEFGEFSSVEKLLCKKDGAQ